MERLGESSAAREDREAKEKMSKLKMGKPETSNRSKVSKNGVLGGLKSRIPQGSGRGERI